MSDIFFYLFENFSGITQCPDAPTLARRLAYEGFEENDVRAAVTLVELLRQPLEIAFLHPITLDKMRIYHITERTHLGDEVLAFIDSLVLTGGITPEQRERVIARALSLPHVPMQAEYFKPLFLTILWAENQDIHEHLLYHLMDSSEGETCH